MKKPVLLSLGMLCLSISISQSTFAQAYTFSLKASGATILEQSTESNGTQNLVFPAGTNLNALGLTAEVPAGAVVTPNPADAVIQDNELEIFTVTYSDGTKRAFPYRFTAGRWFTAILFGDPEVNLTDRPNNNATEANLTKWANNIVAMHNSGKFSFTANKHITPKADIVICMGDMDGDSETSGSAIKNSLFNVFTAANIPFITMAGNHDLVPDYWGSDTSDKGIKSNIGGGYAANNFALNLVTDYLNTAKNNGIENVQRFSQSSGEVQPQPFTFTYKGVRFYVGQTYWFQKPYNPPTTLVFEGTATYYAPNGIISSLQSFVDANASTPSIWVQHYPIGCENRWWLDNNEGGYHIDPTDIPDYTTATQKRNKYMQMISQTKNPVHFSGHNHTESVRTHNYAGTVIKDYVAPYFATAGGCFMVLCHEGEGVKEIQSVTFDY